MSVVAEVASIVAVVSPSHSEHEGELKAGGSGGGDVVPLPLAPPHSHAPGAAFEPFPPAYLIVANSLANTLCQELVRASPGQQAQLDHDVHGEVRAAVWASIQVALCASMLTPSQQQSVLNALRNRLLLPWREHATSPRCAEEGWFDGRAAQYLQHTDARDPFRTAVRIVEILLEASSFSGHLRQSQTRLLAGLVGHRIVSDVWLFNEWVSQGKFTALPLKDIP